MLLIDFAGQSDTFLFDSNEYRRSIIDDLGSNELKQINLKVKNTWNKYQFSKNLLKNKIELEKRKKDNNKASQEIYKILKEANLNSVDEILDLELKENRLAHNFEINNSLKALLKNLNNFNQEEPSVSFVNKSVNKIY